MNRVNRYLLSGFLSTFASLFATLFLIMSIVFFIQIARITSLIEISFAELGKLYLFMIPQILLFTMPIGFFVATAMSFFRLSKENESIVIFTLGQNPRAIARFFLGISAILSVFLLVNSLVVMPYVQNLNSNFIEYKKTKLNLNIKPSEFGQSFGDWMLFVGSQSDENGTIHYRDLAMYNPLDNDEKFILASDGYIVNHESNLELALGHGKMFDVKGDKWHIADYDNMVIRTFFQGTRSKEYSLINYWKAAKTDQKRAKDLNIYALVSLFPLASVLFALSFGIVTYRYDKGIVYFGIFGVLFIYFTLIMLFVKYPFYAIPSIFVLSFALSNALFKQKILAKY